MKHTAAPATVVYDRDLLNDPVVTALLAHVPGVQVRVGEILGEDAEGCHDAEACYDVEKQQPHIMIGLDLVHGDDRADLHAVLAHEVAHHLLGHLRPTGRVFEVFDQVMRQMPLVAAILVGAQRWMLALAVMAAFLLFRWATGRAERRQETEADLRSATLLDELGLPGREMVVAVFDGKEECWQQRWFAWLWSSHPSKAARVRAVRNAK